MAFCDYDGTPVPMAVSPYVLELSSWPSPQSAPSLSQARWAQVAELCTLNAVLGFLWVATVFPPPLLAAIGLAAAVVVRRRRRMTGRRPKGDVRSVLVVVIALLALVLMTWWLREIAQAACPPGFQRDRLGKSPHCISPSDAFADQPASNPFVPFLPLAGVIITFGTAWLYRSRCATSRTIVLGTTVTLLVSAALGLVLT